MAMVKLIDVVKSKATGELVVIERPQKIANFMLVNKRYRGEVPGFGRYAPIEERDKWFEVEEEEPKPEKKVTRKRRSKNKEAEPKASEEAKSTEESTEETESDS